MAWPASSARAACTDGSGAANVFFFGGGVANVRVWVGGLVDGCCLR